MKTILVATDFSNNAYCALHYAAKLFENEPSKLILLHSLKDEISHFINPLRIKKHENELEALEIKVKQNYLAIKHQLVTDLGKTKHTIAFRTSIFALPKAINKIILEEHIDFVVMGRRGQSKNDSILFGRHTFEVIKTIQKSPLLIIPDELDYAEPKTMAFATGLRREHSLSEIRPIIDVATRSGADVKVVHIRDNKKFKPQQYANLYELSKILKFVEAETYWLLDDSNKYKSIMSYIDEAKIDVLIMCYYKHNLIASIFHESVIENITNHIAIPYLLLAKTD